MAFQTVFRRYEFKYLLTFEQKERILSEMEKYMELDKYGRSTIRNLYFDTDDYLLIRRSIEKPEYKEKLRVRSYGAVGCDDVVFVELKKKYAHVVYKRRISMAESEAMEWLTGGHYSGTRTQISAEIDYFLNFYKTLRPRAFISCEREAYCSKNSSDFRVTFDENILFRSDDLSLRSEVCGVPLLRQGQVLMEIKCSGGIPMWMTRLLSEERLFKTSFSKYGTAYQSIIFPKLRNKIIHTPKETFDNV